MRLIVGSIFSAKHFTLTVDQYSSSLTVSEVAPRIAAAFDRVLRLSTILIEG